MRSAATVPCPVPGCGVVGIIQMSCPELKILGIVGNNCSPSCGKGADDRRQEEIIAWLKQRLEE
jgi:hypothetical protein